MWVIQLEKNNLNDSGYYCGKRTTNGEEFLDISWDINHKKVKVYKTQQGLIKGIKYLTDNWVKKDKISIIPLKE